MPFWCHGKTYFVLFVVHTTSEVATITPSSTAATMQGTSSFTSGIVCVAELHITGHIPYHAVWESFLYDDILFFVYINDDAFFHSVPSSRVCYCKHSLDPKHDKYRFRYRESVFLKLLYFLFETFDQNLIHITWEPSVSHQTHFSQLQDLSVHDIIITLSQSVSLQRDQVQICKIKLSCLKIYVFLVCVF